MNYTPQELIIKNKCLESGLSFCINRDYVIIWGNGRVFNKHVDNMNDWLGL